MTEQQAAMRQALDWYDNGNENREEFQGMIRQILEQQPADEPVALQMDVIVGNLVREGINKHRARELAEHFIKYTRPQPAAQWVGLTDDEIERIYDRYGGNMMNCARAIERAIEAKLREKNGGAA